MSRKGFAAGGKIGAKAKRVWICRDCGYWHDAMPPMLKGHRVCSVCGGPAQHFQSRAEATLYARLRLLAREGAISGLECQPKFPLTVNGVNLGSYIADFRYVDETGQTEIVDVKGGAQTELSDLKRRLAEAIYQLDIVVKKVSGKY